MADRVMVFIDGSNLDMATHEAFRRRVNPVKVANKLVSGRRLMRINYYESPLLPEINQNSFNDQQSFFQALRKSSPFVEIRYGRRVKRDKGYTCPHCSQPFTKTSYGQKGVDVLITFDLITLATMNAYDVAILVAGDQDFVCPVCEVRMMNKYVENAFTGTAWAKALKDVTDKHTLLDETFLSDCWQ